MTIRRLARDLAAAPRPPSATAGWACRPRRFGALCQWAVQTAQRAHRQPRPARAARCSPTPAVDVVGRGLLGPGQLRHAGGAACAACPSSAASCPSRRSRRRSPRPGDGQVRGAGHHRRQPGARRPPAAHRLDAALAGLDFMVAIDFYVNETTRHADVILPPTAPLERDHYDLVFHVLAVRNTARVQPGALRARARTPGTTGRSPATSGPRCCASGPTGCVTGGRRRPCRLEARLQAHARDRQLDALLRSSGAGLSRGGSCEADGRRRRPRAR